MNVQGKLNFYASQKAFLATELSGFGFHAGTSIQNSLGNHQRGQRRCGRCEKKSFASCALPYLPGYHANALADIRLYLAIFQSFGGS